MPQLATSTETGERGFSNKSNFFAIFKPIFTLSGKDFHCRFNYLDRQ
jgi:hypothetical protein